MATKKRGLGRGLDALLGTPGNQPSKEKSSVTASEPGNDSQLTELGVECLQRGQYQPRTDMHTESLDELADSIKQQGVVQPIVVRPLSQDKYEIIAGERRWRAAQIAGLAKVPVVIRHVDDRAAIAMALIENIQRENLNPIEEARSLQRLMKEFELTQERAAEAVGRSRSGVANLLRLLDLHADVRTMLENRQIEMGHARALLAIDKSEQAEMAKKVASRQLSVRETEQWVRQLNEPKAVKASPKPLDPNIKRLQADLSDKLGAKTELKCQPNGKGKIIISFNSNDELDGILDHLN
jgi:ParB family chromosome partitioning protein